MAIKINPAHEGLLHEDLSIPPNEPIPTAKLKVPAGLGNAMAVKVKKRVVFAQNAREWKK